MNQQLRRFKETDKIYEYKTHTKRLGKFHLIVNLFLKQLIRFRIGSMTEITEKKCIIKVNNQFEVNEEMMVVIKKAMSIASAKIPEMMTHAGENKQ